MGVNSKKNTKTEIGAVFLLIQVVVCKAKKKNGKETESMKDGYKKVWITLLILVVCAVGIGFFYWAGQKKTPDDGGLLVEQSANRNQQKTESSKERTKKRYECLDLYILSDGEVAEPGMGVTVYGI